MTSRSRLAQARKELDHDGILDTSVVLDLEQMDPPTLPIFPPITSVRLAELSAGPLAKNDPEEQAARGFDALIAATAISRGVPLYTINPADLSGTRGLEVRVPRPVRSPRTS